MTRAFALAALCLLAVPVATAHTATPRYHGRACTPPHGYRIADCRLGVHGAPDLSRAAFRAITGAEVTISDRVTTLAPNPALAGQRTWPLTDSLGQPMGAITTDARGRLQLTGLTGAPHRVTTLNVRGRGCTADPAAAATQTLVQAIAGGADGGGTQAFLSLAAIDAATPDGQAARTAFAAQRSTGCGPTRKVVGRIRALRTPAVGASAHARLSNGALNSVTEYDAKPSFGDTVYFMSNTTSVSVGGVARGMVRVGTPVAKADAFRGCDPNSDGTLTWRYEAISTGRADRPRIYGWIPARCHP